MRPAQPPRPESDPLRLYVEPMDVVLVEFTPDGRVRTESDEWITPSLQERRAIIYSATHAIEELRELVGLLEDPEGRLRRS